MFQTGHMDVQYREVKARKFLFLFSMAFVTRMSRFFNIVNLKPTSEAATFFTDVYTFYCMQTFQLQLVCGIVQGWLAGSCLLMQVSWLVVKEAFIHSHKAICILELDLRLSKNSFTPTVKQPSIGMSRQGDSGILLSWKSSSCKYILLILSFFSKWQTKTAGKNQTSARNYITHILFICS